MLAIPTTGSDILRHSMNRTGVVSLAVAILAGTGLFFGASFVHSPAGSASIHHSKQAATSASQCRSVCALLPNEQKVSEIQDDEADPYPSPFLPTQSGIHSSVFYLVALSALLLALLRRKPPDLQVEYATWRN